MVGKKQGMVNEKSTNPLTGQKEKISKTELKERIEAKLITRGIYDPASANEVQLYQATVQVIKDIMTDYLTSIYVVICMQTVN